MNTQAATIEQTSVQNRPRALPEERFWERYSPHGEAPLSLAGSVTAHALVAGGLVLFGVYLAALFFRPTQSLPVGPVRLEPDGPVAAVGPAAGDGRPGPAPQGLPDAAPRPRLDLPGKVPPRETFPDNLEHLLALDPDDAARAFGRLDGHLRRQGAGPKEGKGPPAGKAPLKPREKRMLRWHMRFTARSGDDYVAQLRGLGATLALPVKEEAGEVPTYRVVRDLRRDHARLEEEDLTKINQIYWIDDRADSVKDVVRVLGLRLKKAPSRFVAFMPVKLEEKLFQMERNYVERVLRQPFNEDRIGETVFRAVRTPSGYKAELISVTMN